MRSPGTHQVLVGTGAGDAITSMARTLRTGLGRLGDSSIHAHYISPEPPHDIVPLAELLPGRADDIVVYHASYGEPEVTRVLLSHPGRLVLVYHNITPSEYFLETDPMFAAGLDWGRHELSLLRDRVDLAVADSQFNADDLAAYGYSDVHVIPAGLRPSRLASVVPSGAMAMDLQRRFPNGYVLSVSQVLPHKRFEALLQAMHLAQWVHETGLGLVIVGPHRLARYLDALRRYTSVLNVSGVWFTGTVSESELAALYTMANMYVTTSAHEGLALPPLEAMSFDVPVIARSAGALPETIGRAGVVLPPDAGPMLISEAIAEVFSNNALRTDLIAEGRRRLSAIEAEDPAACFVELIEQRL